MQIVTRQEAIERNLQHYFTGKSCKYGHVDRRLLSDRTCCECSRIRNATAYAANSEVRKEMAAKWYAANQHRNKTYKARYRAKNREKVRLANADWYSRNKERRNLVIRAWQKANPDAVRVIMENRRARIKATGRLSKGIVKKLIKLQRGKCACCGESLGTNYHLDHITPLALGGSNTDDNVQLLRARCNREKNAKHPVDFMRQRGFLC